MTGVAKNTVTKLLVDVGAACSDYQDRVMRNLTCKRIQCDEIWSFCQMKQKNVPLKKQGQFGHGDVWTWTAIDAQTKLVPTWFVGSRDAESAQQFIGDLAPRLDHRVQLTTDGLKVYVDAVEDAFGTNIDYAMLVKLFGEDKSEEHRYSPPKCNGTKRRAVQGNPDHDHISTSYVERQNLTMRMPMRRFTRLTNAFSKKVENLAAAVSLHFMHYNFVRIHGSLRVTPAMAAGVSDTLRSISDIVELLEGEESSN